MRKIPVFIIWLLDFFSPIVCLLVSKNNLDFIFLTRTWKWKNGYKLCGSTPKYLASIMANIAIMKYGSNSNLKILEPSFGEGSILKEIDYWYHTCIVVACEIDEKMYEEKKKGTYYYTGKGNLHFFSRDFFNSFDKEENNFDIILMNPPFENQAYIKHIMYAYDLLKVGGVIVFLFPEAFSYRVNGEAENFNNFLIINEAEVDHLGRYYL